MDLTQITPRQLGTLLRLGDESAVRHVWAALERCEGSVRWAARTLRVGEITLHEWLRLPALVGAPRQGLAAAGQRAKKLAETRTSEKAT
jgi:hypothetical protein